MSHRLIPTLSNLLCVSGRGPHDKRNARPYLFPIQFSYKEREIAVANQKTKCIVIMYDQHFQQTPTAFEENDPSQLGLQHK